MKPRSPLRFSLAAPAATLLLVAASSFAAPTSGRGLILRPDDVRSPAQTEEKTAFFEPLWKEGIRRWKASGLTARQLKVLENATFEVRDLGGDRLGAARGSSVWIDDDGASRGWFVDPSPGSDDEFSRGRADEGSAPGARVDLLTAILHEQGHVLGLRDHPGPDGENLMDATLGRGSRRGPVAMEAILAEPGSVEALSFLTFSEQAPILRASDDQAGDRFGGSVAIDGDTAVIGAHQEDGGAGDPASVSGAAYVFTRTGTTWSEQMILRASDDQAGDRFGISVAISGDTVVVGAYLEDGGVADPGDDYGAAYVFTRSGTTWTQQQRLRAIDRQVDDNFGFSVAISGDTVVVGAHNEDGGVGDPAVDSGAAYVFTRSGGAWTMQAILRALDRQTDDFFGISVALSGNTAVVGADGEDGGAGGPASNSGAAYVFTRSGVAWPQQQILRASDLQADDNFGGSVAISGNTVVVGAHQEDGGVGDPASQSGAAYVFTRTGSTWSEQAILRASDRQASDNFGVSVAISGDAAVVGAQRDDGGVGDPASESGAAYVFTRSGAAWSQQQILRASDSQADDNFGVSVAISGGITVVGAEREDGGAGDPTSQSGAAYVFGTYRPDGHIGAKAARQKGDNVYNPSGAGQTQKVKMEGRKKGKFFFTAENDGTKDDSFRIGGIRKNKKLKPKVLQLTGGRRNVTAAIGRSRLNLPVASGAKVIFSVKVKSTRKVRGKRTGKTYRITLVSAGDGSIDRVKAKVKKKP